MAPLEPAYPKVRETLTWIFPTNRRTFFYASLFLFGAELATRMPLRGFQPRCTSQNSYSRKEMFVLLRLASKNDPIKTPLSSSSPHLARTRLDFGERTKSRSFLICEQLHPHQSRSYSYVAICENQVLNCKIDPDMNWIGYGA